MERKLSLNEKKISISKESHFFLVAWPLGGGRGIKAGSLRKNTLFSKLEKNPIKMWPLSSCYIKTVFCSFPEGNLNIPKLLG